MRQNVLRLCLIVLSLWSWQGLRAQARQEVYAADVSGNRVFAYTIDPATGFLTSIPGSPFPTGRSPFAIAVDPTGRFAYVAELGTSGVSGYVIDPSSGSLTLIPGSPFAAGTLPASITVDPTGQFVYVANNGFCGDDSCHDSSISAYRIDPGTGALTPTTGSPFPTELLVSLTADPRGRFLYAVALQGFFGYAVVGFEIEPATGNLIPFTRSFSAGVDPRAVVVDPKGRFAYATNHFSGDITAYSMDAASGALTEIEGSPFPAEQFTESAAVDPSSRFLYAIIRPAQDTRNGIRGYAIDSNTGSLSAVPGSPLMTDFTPQALTADATGQFLYVITGGGRLWGYRIEPTTGSLTPVPGSPFVAGAAVWSIVTASQPQVGGGQ